MGEDPNRLLMMAKTKKKVNQTKLGEKIIKFASKLCKGQYTNLPDSSPCC